MPPFLRPATSAAGALAAVLAFAAPPAAATPPAVTVPYADARFEPADPARPGGLAIAVLSGDPAAGPSAMLMRFGAADFPRGAAMHVHTADYHLVVLEGRMKHWAAVTDQAAAPELGPGAYWFQPGGQAHADICLSERCLLFLVWSGARDARLAEAD